MSPFESHIQKEISTKVWIGYGSIGMEYIKLLIVDEGNQIKEVGEFIYRLWQQYVHTEETYRMLTELGKQAELYDKEKEKLFRPSTTVIMD